MIPGIVKLWESPSRAGGLPLINYRIVGFFGSRVSAQEIVNQFQVPEMTTIVTGENSNLSYREDAKLLEEEDLLFVLDDERYKSLGP